MTACRACPRLVDWREKVAREKRASFQNWKYWGKPVPNFGDPAADLLIVGLAPAAHGANRTGRMFTGDRSGDWLYRALHKAGLASQAEADSINDGLELKGVLITAAVHCAPPDNKPTPDEFQACAPFLRESLDMKQWRGILCLGSIAWQAVHKHFETKPLPRFSHGAVFQADGGPKIVGSYHPSQQNTFTGRLTEEMLDAAIAAWKASCKS
ncbi:MAG: uracil-DNA glycosylase [Fimbriimonadaceae bacterium]|nr:uracil-DNA glycosylase [Fimbriimonadaceae bacterium]